MRRLLYYIAWLVVLVEPAVAQKTNGHNNSILDSCLLADKEQHMIIDRVFLKGNQITRDHIILRELGFGEGDTLNMQELCYARVKSRQNLLNRSLFNFVSIDTIHHSASSDHIDIMVDVLERWYLWPLPILELAERNFNVWWETKDLHRANYGFFLTYNNFRGRMEILKVLLRAGYNQNYYLQYEIPYLTKRQNLGMGIQAGRMLSREVPYKTENNKQIYYRNPDSYARQNTYVKLLVSYRDGIHNHHNLTIGFESHKFADTLAVLNPNFLKGAVSEFQMIQLYYLFKHDYRDSRPYPLNGHYLDVELVKKGLGLLKNEPDYFIAKTTADIYRPINQRWYWAASATLKYATDKQEPYFMQRGLGFNNDLVRSNELYVIDGTAFALLKSNLKFELIKPRIHTFNFLKFEKFSKIHYAAYLNLLFDVGYSYHARPDPSNTLQNRLLAGTGIGLDLVTYYDLVWRFEYSINQLGLGGFYIHFVAPI